MLNFISGSTDGLLRFWENDDGMAVPSLLLVFAVLTFNLCLIWVNTNYLRLQLPKKQHIRVFLGVAYSAIFSLN